MGNKCNLKMFGQACCRNGIASDQNGMQLDEKSSKIISLHIDSARSQDNDKKGWPQCDFTELIKIGTVCFMNNQKDLKDGVSLKEIRAKNKM